MLSVLMVSATGTPMISPDDPSGRSSDQPSLAPPDVGVATWMLVIALGALIGGVVYTLL